MDNKLKSGALLLAILLPSLFLIVYYLGNIRPVLLSDPHEERADPLTVERWDALFGKSQPPAPLPWSAPRAITEKDFEFNETPTGYSISYDSSIEDEGSWKPVPPETICVPKSTQTTTLSTGETITLKTLGTGYQTGESDYENHSFDAITLEPIEPSILKNTDITQSGVAVLARFKTSSRLHYPREVRIFNRDTHMQIGEYPWLYAEKNKRLEVTTTITQWHPSPVYYVLDLDGGNETHSTFPLKVGEKIRTEPVTIQLVFAKEFSGRNKSTSHSHEETYKTTTLNRIPFSKGTTTVMGFAVTGRRWIPESIGFKPNTAKVKWWLSITGEQILKNFFLVSFPASIADIGSLDVHSPKSPCRLIFELDTLPGLPPENSDLDNLFDAMIPNRPIGSPLSSREWISRTAHLENRGHFPTTISGSQTTFFENRTLSEITRAEKRRSSWYSIGTTTDHQLVIEPRAPWAGWIDIFKSKLP